MTVDPRTITGAVLHGTPLRDAAVDPEPRDYLPPTNAGEPGELGNPHGPSVVAPGIHGEQGVRPIRPGAVSGDPDVQEAAETEHTRAWHPATVAPEPEPEGD